jgi:hypothetical protein
MDRRRMPGKGSHYESVGELRSLSELQLVSKYEAWMAHVNKLPASDKTALTNRAQTYTNELLPRQNIRQGERMEALTRETVSQGKRLEDLTKSLNRLT